MCGLRHQLAEFMFTCSQQSRCGHTFTHVAAIWLNNFVCENTLHRCGHLNLSYPLGLFSVSMFSFWFCPCWRALANNLSTHVLICFWDLILNGFAMQVFAQWRAHCCGALWNVSGWSRDHSRWVAFQNGLRCNMRVMPYALLLEILMQSWFAVPNQCPHHLHVTSLPQYNTLCNP